METTQKNRRLVSRSYTLTPEATTALQHLSQEASDALGRTVGGSAMIRVLIEHAAQQPPGWAAATLHPLIEKEIASGIFQGGRRKK
jgi:hypothetical protein